MLRALTLATLLFAATIAFGGAFANVPDVTENVRAECIQIDGVDDCGPSPGCIIALVVATATGKDPVCTM